MKLHGCNEISIDCRKKNLPRMMSIQNVYNLVNRVFDISNSEVSKESNVDYLPILLLQGEG